MQVYATPAAGSPCCHPEGPGTRVERRGCRVVAAQGSSAFDSRSAVVAYSTAGCYTVCFTRYAFWVRSWGGLILYCERRRRRHCVAFAFWGLRFMGVVTEARLLHGYTLDRYVFMTTLGP